MGEGYELAVERRMAAAPEAVWRAMTGHLEEWFCPAPWRAEVVAFEQRPGGRMTTVMHGPDGERIENDGVVLEFLKGRRIVFTDAFGGDWVPRPAFMVGGFEIRADGDGTLYRGWARHWSEDARIQHEAMGFAQGWAAVAAQLEAVALRLG